MINVIVDFTFIKNKFPANTPKAFKRKHTIQFLQLIHPEYRITWEECLSWEGKTPVSVIEGYDWMQKLKRYGDVYGVWLNHIIIPNQTSCIRCGELCKPEASEGRTITVYTSLKEEPSRGTIFSSRCVARRSCGHRSHYGWDLFRGINAEESEFKVQKNRHELEFWVISNSTAFKTAMIQKELFPQVL